MTQTVSSLQLKITDTRRVGNCLVRPQSDRTAAACALSLVVPVPSVAGGRSGSASPCLTGAVVRRGTTEYTDGMTPPRDQSADVSVRQFVADSGSITRGLRQGRAYTLTLNGEPLAKMIPIRRRQAVPKEEVLGIFASAPVINVDELRADLDESVAQDLQDPYEGTGL